MARVIRGEYCGTGARVLYIRTRCTYTPRDSFAFLECACIYIYTSAEGGGGESLFARARERGKTKCCARETQRERDRNTLMRARERQISSLRVAAVISRARQSASARPRLSEKKERKKEEKRINDARVE